MHIPLWFFCCFDEVVSRYKSMHPGAVERMPPGGDPAFLIFWFFCIKTKERKSKQPQVC
ncbi:MAG: hypothetical protein ACRYFL_07725 [Janthinobacterium lividum]